MKRSMSKPNRQRGRPKDQTKLTALLNAARDLFLAKGLDVTLDEIAGLANVSKATIYSHVASKEDLIEAVIRRESDRTITDEEFRAAQNLPIKEALLAFGLRYVNFINGRELYGWDRLIASASAAHPELPRRFFDIGPGRGQELLTNIIAKACSRNELLAIEPAVAADNLAGLWLGFVNLEIKLGVREPLSKEEISLRVSHGVELFLKLYGNAGAMERFSAFKV